MLVAGRGVEGDAHFGEYMKHRSRWAKNRMLPNIRQVHLIHAELLAELAGQGFAVGPAAMGENILTRGVDLLALPQGARLAIGAEAVVELTGLRNPCYQLDRLSPGLMKAVLDKGPDGEIVRKCGVMGVVVTGGAVAAGDAIVVALPDGERRALEPV